MDRRLYPHFKSVRTQLAVLYAGLFAITMFCVTAALYVIVERNAEAQVRRELVASGTVFDRLWTQRSDQMRYAAGLLARDFGFRAAVGTHDTKTIESALANLRDRLGLPLAFIVDPDGNVVGLPDSGATRDARALAGQLDNDVVAGVTTIGGAARHVVAAPIMAPALMGWVVFATNLDRHEMAGLEALSAIPLTATVYQKRGGDGWTTGDAATAEPVRRFIESRDGRAAPSSLDGADGTTIALVKPLPIMAGSPPTVLLLQYPLSRALAAYRSLQIGIALLTLVGLAFVILAAFRMAQTITRPISLLDDAASRLAEGDSIRLAVDRGDELGRLANSFNRMVDEISERERRIAHLAFNDVLTGLPNRALFQEKLDRDLRSAERRRGGVALFCLDLDDFKTLNDALGHPVGDELLRLVARRLSDMDEDMFVARLGGDEFVVIKELADERRDIETVEALGQRLIAVLQVPGRLGPHEVVPRVSIGIAVGPADGNDGATLLKNADLALYQAKEAGWHTVRFFKPELNARAQSRRAIEMDLRRALANGELELFFQPLYDLAKRRVTSFETLLRWRHPTRGLVPPIEFIPVAEETGLIVPIGAWALREACRQAMTWNGDIRVAVNVSTVQIYRPGLAQTVLQSLQGSALPPARLELEITESIFLESGEETLKLLHELRAIGVRITLDDFGTGYSSLSYLQSFPFDKVKIDRSFVIALANRPGAGAIVQAIIDLAQALGMETTAEGVEDGLQLAELERRGCDTIQGYLIGKPVPAREVPGILAGRIDPLIHKAAG